MLQEDSRLLYLLVREPSPVEPGWMGGERTAHTILMTPRIIPPPLSPLAQPFNAVAFSQVILSPFGSRCTREQKADHSPLLWWVKPSSKYLWSQWPKRWRVVDPDQRKERQPLITKFLWYLISHRVRPRLNRFSHQPNSPRSRHALSIYNVVPVLRSLPCVL